MSAEPILSPPLPLSPSPTLPPPQIFQAGPVDRGLSADLSLSAIFNLFIKPVWLKSRNVSDLTLAEYETSLAYWTQFTRDPPLAQIDDWTTTEFLTGLYALPARGPKGAQVGQVSPYTIKKHCTNVQTCLCLCGPRTPKHPKAKRLILEVPYLDKPAVELPAVDDNFALDEIWQIMEAAKLMKTPRIAGVTAEAWWQSLIAVAYNTGERRGALLGVGYADLKAGKLTFPRGIRKGKRRSKTIALNEPALEAVERIRTDRPKIFEWRNWPKNKRWFAACWTRLLKRAGIPPERRFGLHGLRKAAATEAAAINPLAAQLLLGHSNFKMTQEHYINPKILADTLARLPQPRARKAVVPASNQRQLFDKHS